MVTTRWGRAGLEAVAPKIRWGRAGVDGTASTVPKLRWGRAGMTGTAAVLVAVMNPQSVEPEQLVTLTAALVGGGSADSWNFRVSSGQPVSFLGTGATRQWIAPSMMPPAGGSSTIAVSATVGGTTSPERTVVITYLPQTRWQFVGGIWIGRKPAVAL
jgi:hypothetical protein